MFSPQIFSEYQLCTRHCHQLWGQCEEKTVAFVEMSVLMGKMNKNKKFQNVIKIKYDRVTDWGSIPQAGQCVCSVTKSYLTLCNPMDCSRPGCSVLHCLQEFAQIQVHCVNDAIQPSHPLLLPSSFAFNLSQHQGLFQRVSSSYQVAKVLELQLQHHSFQ